MKIPLLNSNNKVELVKVEDIIFTALENDKLAYHTKDSIFHTIDTLKHAAEFLSSYGFEAINHEQVAQLDRVVAYCRKSKEAAFLGGKTCPISRRNYYKIKNIIKP